MRINWEEYNLPSPKWFIPCALGMTLLTILLFVGLARGEIIIDGKDYNIDEVVRAIGEAENSVKYPYGIKSIDTKGNKAYARQICYNSVKNNLKRWLKAGKPEDFVLYMSRRYCPINAPDDNGTNRFWSRNVLYYLKKGRK